MQHTEHGTFRKYQANDQVPMRFYETFTGKATKRYRRRFKNLRVTRRPTSMDRETVPQRGPFPPSNPNVPSRPSAHAPVASVSHSRILRVLYNKNTSYVGYVVRKDSSESAVCLFNLLTESFTEQTLETHKFCLFPKNTANALTPSHRETPFKIAFRATGRPATCPLRGSVFTGVGETAYTELVPGALPRQSQPRPGPPCGGWEPVPDIPVPGCQRSSVPPRTIPALPIINASAGLCQHVQGSPLQPNGCRHRALGSVWHAPSPLLLRASLRGGHDADVDMRAPSHSGD